MGFVLWVSEDYRGVCLRILATETDDVDASLSYNVNCSTSVTGFSKSYGSGSMQMIKPSNYILVI